MSHNAVSSSLSARINAMALAPDLQAVLSEMAVRVEHATEFQEMMRRAHTDGTPSIVVPPLLGPKHKRDRHGLHMLPGGLAALVPVALLGHGAPAGVAAAARWLWGSARGRAVASVLAVSTGAAVAIPVTAAEQAAGARAPHPPAVVQPHHRRHHQAGPGWMPVLAPAVHRRRRRHHRSRRSYDAIVAPTPPASPPPPPSPSPSPTGLPTPAGTVPPAPSPSATLGDGVPRSRVAARGLIWLDIATKGLP